MGPYYSFISNQSICPFLILFAVLNGGSFLGSALGSALTKSFGVTSDNFDNLAPLVALCTVSMLAPLPLLRLLPKDVDSEKNEREKHEA